MSAIDLGISVTVANNASAALKSISGDVKGLGDNSQATANRLKAIQVVIAGILLEKTLEYGKAVTDAVSSTQQLDIRLAAFAGSAQSAHKVWDDLAQSFIATPFTMDAITASWIKLRSVMSSNDQATTTIKSIVNDVAALGGTDENITNLSEAFQRMFASGSASAREYKSILQQTGLTLGDLAKAAGKSSTDMERELKAGFVSAQSFVNDFVTASNQRFGFFAQNLSASVGGSISSITNTISKDISNLGATTDLNAHMTVIFQNIAKAIDQMMQSISQKDIDNFFQWMKDMEPVVINVATGLLNIGTAVFEVGTAMATLLGKMPPEALEYGMVGYFLLGKKGALLGAVIGGIMDAANKNQIGTSTQIAPNVDTGGLTGWIKQQDADAQAWFNRNGLSWLNKSLDQTINEQTNDKKQGGLLGVLGINLPPAKPLFDFVGDQKQLDAEKDKLTALYNSFKPTQAAAAGMSSALSDAMAAAQRETAALNDTLKTTQDRLGELTFKNQGDELGSAIQAIKLASDGYLKSIDSAIKAEDTLKIHTAANLAIVAQLKALKVDINNQTDIEIQKERALYALQTQSFVAQQRANQIQNDFSAKQLALQSTSSAGSQMFQGTGAGQMVVQTLQQQAQYLQQIQTLTAQIADDQAQLNTITADPARTQALNNTIASLANLRQATMNSLQSLSAEGQLTKQVWQNAGNILENDVANGITGLIEGTATLGGVARSVFSDLLSMAIKYLIQLVAIQLFSKAATAASTALAAPEAAAMTAIWSPAAMAASIASYGSADVVGAAAFEGAMAASLVPFALGGVPMGGSGGGLTTGPTLFGLAGEAGQEAIMPLTRVGGKLGVHASGMGGDTHYHIHVQAIDTQSGMEFIAANIPQIDAQLKQRTRLNKKR